MKVLARLLLVGTVLVWACGTASADAPTQALFRERVNFSDIARHAAVRAAYYDSLRVCRLQQPGRLNHRMHLAPTEDSVGQCLKRRGVA